MSNLHHIAVVRFLCLVLIAMLATACNGTRAFVNETWTLVELLTIGERVDTVSRVREVRNCGAVEDKTVHCSAGTSNELIVGANAGWSEVFEIGGEVSTSLGIGRTSGESTELPVPPEGFVYQYVVTEEYSVLAGEVLARSSAGDEKPLDYAFYASCSLRVDPPVMLTCAEAERSTPMAQPPQTVTSPTAVTECSSDMTCYSVELNELDPQIWCQVPTSGLDFETGRLIATAHGNTAHEIHPCPPLSSNLRFVELTLSVVPPSGPPGKAHAGIGASLGNDRYVYIKLDLAGDAYSEQGVHGESPTRVTTRRGIDSTGAPHTLRIEYTGSEVLFFVDGTQMGDGIASDEYGHWFLLTVASCSEASIAARLDSVRWGVASP